MNAWSISGGACLILVQDSETELSRTNDPPPASPIRSCNPSDEKRIGESSVSDFKSWALGGLSRANAL